MALQHKLLHFIRGGAQRGMDGFHVIGGDFAGFVAPRNADVSQHGGKAGVGTVTDAAGRIS